MDYHIRLMGQGDIPQVAEIDLACFPTMLPATNYHNEFINPLAHYIVISNDDGPNAVILGFAGIWLLSGEAHIVNLAVREAHRREGWGELLLIGLIQQAQGLRASMITLEVRASNVTAQQLYVKYNLAERGRRRGYYTDNREDALIMTLDDPTSPTYEAFFRTMRHDYEVRWQRDACL
jgi:ribosomal-protein-alanine N-acetyltransferase